MKLVTIAYALMGLMTMISGLLFVLFGQKTVRKLRKKPETKDVLGVQFMSGWDILNTAQAMAFPRSWSRKLSKSPLSGMHANADLLFQHTTKFDQVLAFVFYWFFMATGVVMATVIILDSNGYLDS